MWRIIYAISILSGTIIGVGFFALPYLTLQVGPWLMLSYFVILGTVVILLHYFFAEIAIKTADLKRLPGFVKEHLGLSYYRIALIVGILGILGANLAYLIVGGRFLSAITEPILGFGDNFYTFFYFLIGSLLIFFGAKAIGQVQFWGLILLLIIFLTTFIQEREAIDISSLTFELDFSYFLIPYGVVLFSLWGLGLVPEAEEILGKRKDLLKKIVIWAIIIPIIIYLFFIFLILGLMGTATPPDALTGLQNFLNDELVFLILFLAVLTTFTSYIALGLTLKKILWYDLGINRILAWIITCFPPLIFYFLGAKDFIQVIALIGGTMLAIEGILVSLMYRKVGRASLKPLVYPIIFILVIGAVCQIIFFFL